MLISDFGTLHDLKGICPFFPPMAELVSYLQGYNLSLNYGVIILDVRYRIFGAYALNFCAGLEFHFGTCNYETFSCTFRNVQCEVQVEF
jgi:hypothetical protein